MGHYSEHTGTLDASGMRIGIVAARFNDHITKLLLDGALDGLREHGVGDADIRVVWVPGAFEIPLAAQRLATSGRVDAVICIGAVIRGETAHFEYVAGPSAAGMSRVALDTGIPVIFGVLTTEDDDQAYARAGGAEGNKGFEAAVTAIEMVDVLRQLAKEDD